MALGRFGGADEPLLPPPLRLAVPAFFGGGGILGAALAAAFRGNPDLAAVCTIFADGCVRLCDTPAHWGACNDSGLSRTW